MISRLLPFGSLALTLVVSLFPVSAEEAGAASELLPPLSGGSGGINLSQDLAPQSLKPKMTILDTTVSLDGVNRPDLGTSLTDTMTAKLLRTSDYDLIDAGNVNGMTDVLSPLLSRTPTTPGPSTALEVGKAVGADFVVVPTLLGLQGEFRVTMRKLVVPSGKIEAIVQETIRGDLAAVFKAFEFLAQRLAPEKIEKPRFTYVMAWMSPPPPQKKVDHLAAEIASAPKALPASNISSAKLEAIEAAKRAWSGVNSASREPRRTGQIEVVDHDWCFCEIACNPSEVHANDQIFAWSGRDLDTLVSMTVTRVEGNRAIADFGHNNPHAAALKSGDTIYRWVSASHGKH